MIPITRVRLDDNLTAQLDRRTIRLKDADSVTARNSWKTAHAEKAGIRRYLEQMAAGVQRCMYCADSLGTDIDHFEPIKECPAGTFVWPNHLLACSFCNSNQKRDRFPRDSTGQPLLIDPTRENPTDHLRLILRSGEYRARTPQGKETIEVFGLNRPDLTRGRSSAFEMAKAALCRAHGLVDACRHSDAISCLRALTWQPHASVLREMLHSASLPGGPEVLGGDVIAAIAAANLHNLWENTSVVTL